MRKLLIPLVLLALLAGGVSAYYRLRGVAAPPEAVEVAVSRGDIVDTVGATGALQAVTTVQVGTQVSGSIQELAVDFNSIVRKGQIIARLEPSLFQTQVEQAQANLIRARADQERLRVGLDDARTKLQRAGDLAARNLIPQSELEAAQVAVRTAEAQLRSAEAQHTQAEASLNQAKVNLQHTVIASPIDGIVVSRNVDVGQTVAASMQAPTLYVLAADLTKMQVNASIDEADVGRIRPGQRVRFRVDAYPNEEFIGTVSQVRLQPITIQNVVTYATVIDVPNPDLKLKPGMTATVTVEVARRDDVVRIPNAALRFRPTQEMFAALNQEPPEFRAEGFTPQGSSPGRNDASARPTEPPVENGGPGAVSVQQGQPDADRRRALRERLATMSPDEREQLRQQMRASGGRPGAERTRPAARQAESPAVAGPPRASTIDALFGPLPPVESVGRVWLFVNGQLKPVRVRLGISDGSFTELLGDELQPGTEVVSNLIISESARATRAGTGRSPLLPQRPGGGRGSGPPGVRNPPPATPQ